MQFLPSVAMIFISERYFIKTCTLGRDEYDFIVYKNGIMDQLDSLAWEITNCSKQAIPLVAMIHFPLKPLHGWLQHTVWWITSLLAEDAKTNLLLVQERFHVADENVNLPSRFENLAPSLSGILNHRLHRILEKSQVFLVAWSKINSEAALLDSPETWQHILDHKSICGCTIE